jgi:poly(A) polymerase
VTRSIAGAEWLLRRELAAVFDAIEQDGDALRVVGGAVRNTLLGVPVADVDLATTALPAAVMARAAAAGLKPVPTGIEHGTVTVVSSGVPHEVTTLRADIETDGRRAVVRFGTDWDADARRRDFTMNALYADRTGQLFDPVGGYDDCVAGRVRFIGDPETRIREDFLRILRFFRFHSAYGRGPLDAEGLAACIRLRDGLTSLSRERIGQEMRRLVVEPRGAEVAALMQESGVLLTVLGGVARPAVLARLGEADPALALAALGAFVEDDAERLAERLKLSNAERKAMAAAVKLARWLGGSPTEKALREAVYREGNATAADALQLATAIGGVAVDADLLSLAQAWKAPVLPIAAADLMAIGIKPGPALGKALSKAEKAWIASDFSLAKAELLSVAGN